MAEKFVDRLKHAWSAFNKSDEFGPHSYDFGSSTPNRPDQLRIPMVGDQSFVTAIYNQIAIDAASVELRHVRLDDEGRFSADISSGLDYCMTQEANIDQTGFDFRLDLFMTIIQTGAAAIVPIVTDNNPTLSNMYDIKDLRVGQVVEWMPRHVRVSVYDDRSGKGVRQEIILPKTMVAIVKNPRYSVMNDRNSSLQRLTRKLALLDASDEQINSGKLDLIFKLPYAIKTSARRAQAAERAKELEMQLRGSKYGIGYIDAAETVTPLNRPVENNLMNQIPYLTTLVYNQLGMTEAVLTGTADEKTMLTYHNRTIAPLLMAASEEISRTFLSKTARAQKQTIQFYRDPFKLVPVEMIAEIADKFTRAQVLTANEVRQIIGRKPVKNAAADTLANPNLNQPNGAPAAEEDTGAVDELISGLEADIEEILGGIGKDAE